MQISSLQSANAMLMKSPVSRAAAKASTVSEAEQAGSAVGAEPVTSKRPDLPVWKTERNAWHDLHKSTLTADWFSARASWMSTRDASQSSPAPVNSISGQPATDPVVPDDAAPPISASV
jgi:hypothetical protein